MGVFFENESLFCENEFFFENSACLVRLLVELFDLVFAFGVLACRILDCASLLCGLLSDKLRCLRLELVTGFWNLAKALRKFIDVHFLRF